MEAKKYLSNLLEKYTKENVPVLFCVSGGSALSIIQDITFDKLVTIIALDERFTTDEKNNNSILIKERIGNQNNLIQTIPKQNETLNEFGKRYEREIFKWIENNPQGKIVATMGMGNDGHTAGIMPFENINNFSNENFVYVYETDKSEHRQRATTTFTFLKKIDKAIMFISDKTKKQEAFNKLISKDGNLSETPARIIYEMKDVSVFVDF